MSNIKRYTSIYKRSLATKLGRVVAYEKRLLHRKFILPSYDHVRSLDELKHYISTCTRLMATRSYNVVAENKGQQTTKWYGPLITWLHEVTWQMKNIISIFSRSMAIIHKLTWLFGHIKLSPNLQSQMTLRSYSCEVTWHTKITQLNKNLLPSNITGWWFVVRSYQLKTTDPFIK